MTSKNLDRTFKSFNNKNGCIVSKRTLEVSKEHHTSVKTDINKLYLCNTCSQKISLTENSTIEFLSGSKSDKEKFDVCKCCHKKLFMNKTLKKHNFSFAKRENAQFMCEICVKNLSNKENLKMHCFSYNRNLICKVCNEVFYSTEELERHNFTHIEKYNVCKICKMKISSVRKYQSQLCKTCEEDLLLKNTLKQHCLSHKNRDIERKLSKTVLKMHCLVLAPNTPFVCGICKDGFSCKNELLQHYPVHTGEKSHKRTNCTKNHSICSKDDKCSQTNEVYF